RRVPRGRRSRGGRARRCGLRRRRAGGLGRARLGGDRRRGAGGAVARGGGAPVGGAEAGRGEARRGQDREQVPGAEPSVHGVGLSVALLGKPRSVKLRSMAQEVVLVRHGETEWSKALRHTGSTDIPLTEEGCRQAGRVAEALRGRSFALVLTSPLQRAAETCRLAGFRDVAQTRDELLEWDYGDYEGRRTA